MSVLDAGRRMAESRMTDSCTVARDGVAVWDEAAGEDVATPVVVFSGPCRVKSPTTAARGVEAGSQLLVMSELEVHLPFAAEGVTVGDVVTITGSVTRPGMVGRRFRVVAPFDGSQTTALRFRVEVADGRG